MTLPTSAPSPRTLHDSIDKNDLPRERLRRLGAGALKNEELIAIILRTGSPGEHVLDLAARLLRESNGLEGLAHLTYSQLLRIRGIKEAKAIELEAAIELGRRVIGLSPEERPMIKSPAQVADLLSDMSCLEQEVICRGLTGHQKSRAEHPNRVSRLTAYHGHPGDRAFPRSSPAELCCHYRRAQSPFRRSDPFAGYMEKKGLLLSLPQQVELSQYPG